MLIIDEIVRPLLNIDVRTLIAVLFWGNVVSVLLVYAYKLTSPSPHEKALSSYYVPAKLAQSLAHFLFFFRSSLPDILSVNAGNTLLFLGFFWEAASMLTIIQGNTDKRLRFVAYITACNICVFNLVAVLAPDIPSLWVVVSSICVFLTLLVPTVLLLLGKKVSRFKRIVGLFYVLFLAMLLPRAFLAFQTPIHILSNTVIQTLTFLSLILLMIFSLSAYLLLMKESDDEKMRKLATVDALSGLANRHSFLLSAERAFAWHKNNNSSLALLFFDLDRFKIINDTYGHAFGDTVIRAFADELRKKLRSRDMPCRYGGEEFLVLLPQAKREAAESVCLRIMKGLKELRMEDRPEVSLTVSCGIALGAPGPEDTLEKYINMADSAMYQAKRTGRDRFVLHHAGGEGRENKRLS